MTDGPLATSPEEFGRYLVALRNRIDPSALGLSAARRRTKGLRREEVAARAEISPAWYTGLEQGRGGTASPAVLERLSTALLLSSAEREHLFLMALGRSPTPQYDPQSAPLEHLQHVLDALLPCPAVIRTATWDVLAWNRAASIVLADYGRLDPGARNVLRLLFCDEEVRAAQLEWEQTARFVVGVFRSEITRAGATTAADELIESLRNASVEFERLWTEHEIHDHGVALKRICNPIVGNLNLEHSSLAANGRPDVSLVVYKAQSEADLKKLRELVASSA